MAKVKDARISENAKTPPKNRSAPSEHDSGEFSKIKPETDKVEIARGSHPATSSEKHPMVGERMGGEFLLGEQELSRIIQEAFISDSNYEDSLALFSSLAREGMDFKLGRKEGPPIVDFRQPAEIRSGLLEPLPQKGLPISEVVSEVKEKIVRGSVNFSSPGFMAFPDCGNSIAGLGAHVLSGFLNQNLINSFHTSPTATYVEMAVINWLREAVGFSVNREPKGISDVGGINVPGGVLANTVGLLLARENRFPGTMQDGIAYDPSKVKVFLPYNISHYSSRAAMGWLGLGTSNIIDVKTTEGFTIDREDLQIKIEHQLQLGNTPLALVAYCGDSRTMAIDDFTALAGITRRYGIWLHVDACHGLSLCFTKRMRERVRSIENADSITIDPHKVLFVPYALSYVLVREPERFGLVAGISDLITKEEYSFGQITPFLGSRAFNSLKLWMLIKHLGSENIGKLVEHRHGIALYFSERISKEDGFYPMNHVSINNLAYLFVPGPIREMMGSPDDKTREQAIKFVNELSSRIQTRIFKEGRYYVHSFQLNDFGDVFGMGPETVFHVHRVSVGNPLTTTGVIDGFVDYLKKVCASEYADFALGMGIGRRG